MSKLRDSKTYSINDFLNWYDNDSLELSPKFQRNRVWNHSAKSYLIDTILRGMPIPPIFITQKIDLETKKTLREVIDGQQRLTAITEFKNNELQIQKSHSSEFGGKFYNELTDAAKISFLEYEIPVEIIKTEEDALIYDIFARLNTNNIVLNKQELRNSKYWGEFKVVINRLSVDYNQFFANKKTFTDQQFARMADSEFLSSLLILTIDGIIAESSAVIDNYYKQYDQKFEDLIEKIEKLKFCFSYIESIFELNLRPKFFNKKVAFYTLFAVVLHSQYRIRNADNDLPTLDLSDKVKFKTAISEIESKIDGIKDSDMPQEEFKRYTRFIELHKIRTTNQKERKERIRWLLAEIIKYY